jgi:hypothetical protein
MRRNLGGCGRPITIRGRVRRWQRQRGRGLHRDRDEHGARRRHEHRQHGCDDEVAHLAARLHRRRRMLLGVVRTLAVRRIRTAAALGDDGRGSELRDRDRDPEHERGEDDDANEALFRRERGTSTHPPSRRRDPAPHPRNSLRYSHRRRSPARTTSAPRSPDGTPRPGSPCCSSRPRRTPCCSRRRGNPCCRSRPGRSSSRSRHRGSPCCTCCHCRRRTRNRPHRNRSSTSLPARRPGWSRCRHRERDGDRPPPRSTPRPRPVVRSTPAAAVASSPCRRRARSGREHGRACGSWKAP